MNNIKSKIANLKWALCLLCVVLCCPIHADTVGMQALGDSLFAWTGFSRIWSPNVRVKSMRIDGDKVTIKTNATLKDVRWTPDNIRDVKRHVSRWTLGHEKGKVTIYTGKTDIESLLTECAKGTASNAKNKDLTDHNIALWPSHGLYYNRDRDQWIWQRATLWTTVEDLYSQEYVRLVKRMLENAGANVLMPRASIDQQQLGQSGMPQWTEGARYWLISQNADSTLWNLYEGDEYKDDMKCRAMWVNSLEVPVDLCLALHTDGLDSGDDSTTVGTLVIYTAKDDDNKTTLRDGRDREKTNRNLADWIQTSVVKDLRHLAPEWTRRQLKEANYCETRVPVVPSLILEVLSHKNMADMRYGLDPQFRFVAARAIYKGILRYINGPQATVQPLPVKDLGIQIVKSQASSVNLRWQPSLDSLEASAAPAYYMVYIQQDDGEWDIQQVEKKTELKLDLKPDVKYNFYVVAGNDGGLSLPSPIVSAYLTGEDGLGQTGKPVLIVDCFDDSYGPQWFADSAYAGIVPGSYACEDYFSCAYIGQQWDYDRSHLWINDDNCGFGACYRDHTGQFTVGNTHDYAALHGHVLRKMKISYISCTAGMMDNLSPITDYLLLDLICGRNREPFTHHTSPITHHLSSFLDAGGKVLLSTDHFSALDQTWAKRYLHASYHAANATRSGRINGARHRLYQLVMEPNEEQLFCPNPEALKPEKEATKWATYEDMRCTAAVATTNTLVFSFPLEAVQDFDKIYKHAIQWLLDIPDGYSKWR